MATSGVPLTDKDKDDIKRALKKTGGFVRQSAKLAGVEYNTIYNAAKKDPSIQKAIDDAREERRENLVAIAEKRIAEKMDKELDTTSIIFTLKTLGKDRGWSQDEKSFIQALQPIILDYAKAQAEKIPNGKDD